MRRLPGNGIGWDVLKAQLEASKANDFDWRKGVLPLYVYWRDEALEDVVRNTHSLFFTENALGRRAFPSVAKLEAEVIEMALGLFNADPAAGGSFTAGGTESIFQAVKTARDHARANRPRVETPNMVIPYSAHPAFNKAAHYLDIGVVRVKLRDDFRADVDAMGRAIDSNTILIAGSAPGFPHGVFDPIGELAELARARDLWLHVDACVGGFLAPFVRRLGYPIPPFDFSVPGVTSISADLHKYGFAAKGASLILFRDAELQRYQRFEFRDWPRGFYATDTFLGTRPGAPVAVAWAVMNYLGEDGYLDIARTTMAIKEELLRGIDAIPGLKVVEPHELSFLLYRSIDPALDIAAVADGMAERGWFVGRSMEPPAVHLMLNPVHGPVVGRYVADLAASAAEARRSERVGTVDERTY
jgi:sphinganine-1-phosphate aldolase